MMRSLLIHVRPLDLLTNARVDIYVGSAGDAAALGLGDRVWESAVTQRPRLSIELLTETLDGKIQPGRGDVVLNLESVRQVARPAALYWTGAPITILDADGLDLATAPVEFTGIVRDAPLDDDRNSIRLNCEVSTQRLDRPVLPSEFDGSGGVGGAPDKRGVLKPAGFGSVPNVEPVWFDEVRNIGMVDGYGNLIAVNWLGEGGADFGPPVADYPDYDALAAAIDGDLVPEGRWATCIAEGLIGLGAPPAGVITCDCVFGIDRVGALMRHLIASRTAVPPTDIDDASFSALDAAVDYPIHYWTADQRQVIDLIEALAASCNATPIVTFQGDFAVTRAFGGALVGHLDRQGGSSPRVTAWAPGVNDPPVWKLTARAARPGRVLTYDEVNFDDDLIDRGAYRADETYRLGNLVWLADGSQWLYINDLAAAGNAPPAPPATVNDYWRQVRPAMTASDLFYADGTPIEQWKPATSGATRNVNRGAWTAGVEYEVGDIVQYGGDSWSVDVAHTASAGAPPPNANVSLFVPGGSGAPALMLQWSVSGSGSWHSDYVTGDLYFRTSNDGGLTWSAAIRAIGEDGDPGPDGNFKQFVFKRSATQPAAPTGNGVPSGWSDAPPTGSTDPLWMASALQSSGRVLIGSWSTPIQINAMPLRIQWSVNGSTLWHDTFTAGDKYLRTSADGGTSWSAAAKAVGETGDGKKFVFKRSATQPATPSGAGVPATWSDGPPADNGQPLWMSTSTQDAAGNLVVGWTVPVQLSALALKTQWSADGSTLWHDTFAIGDKYLRTSADGGATWSTAAKVVGEDGDGLPGDHDQFVFKRSAAQPATPTGNGIPSGWADGPPAPDGNALWMSKARQSDAGVTEGSWSTPVRLDAAATLIQWSVNGSSSWHATFTTGDLFMRTSVDGGVTWSAAVRAIGEAGIAGGDGNIKQLVFRRSAAQPSTPSGNGIPSGWSDGPPADNGQPLWMSASKQTAAGVLVVGWSTPVQIDGDDGVSSRAMDIDRISLNFYADYEGVVKPDQQPLDVKATYMIGATDVSSTTTWTLPSIVGATVTVNSVGKVTIDSVITNGYVDIRGSRDGVVFTKRVTFQFVRDAPPVQTSTSTTTTDVGNTDFSGTFPAGVSSAVLLMTASPAGSIKCVYVTNQKAFPTPPYGSPYYIQFGAVARYRVAGSGSAWSDFPGGPVTGGVSSGDPPNGIPPNDAVINLVQTKTGLTAGILYEVGVAVRDVTRSGCVGFNIGSLTVSHP